MIRCRLAAVLLTTLAALVSLVACTTDPGPTVTTSAVPQVSPTQNTLQVSLSTFQVAYRLDGTVASSSAVGIDVPPGTILVPSVNSNTQVTASQRLGLLRLAGTGNGPQGTVSRSQRLLAAARVGPMLSPIVGAARLTSASARVDSPGLDVVVPLKPLQELRYRALDFDGKATVETVLGQRRSRCVAVWLEALPTASDGAEQGASSAVHCRLAADVETAAGLPAVLNLTSVRQDDVLAVPLIYIGLDKAGKNYIARLREGGTIRDQPVVVSSTDGVRRVITDGLKVGDVLSPIESS